MIIGLCGIQGAGKDTVSDILVQKFGFIKLSFGSVVKDVVSSLFGWNREMLEGQTIESRIWREQVDEYWSNKMKIENFTPRKALQLIGTDLFRKHFDENIWINIVENKINQLIEQNPSINVVISDCRFNNEITMIKKFKNSYLFCIIKDKQQFNDEHISELEWKQNKYDKLIVNNKSIMDLEQQVLVLYQSLIL